MKRGLQWVAGLAALVVIAAFGYLVIFIAPIGDAYTAKMLCSGVFVAQRPAEQVRREDILADNNPFLPLVDAQVDVAHRRVNASFLGLARRVAVFREGLGCTVAIHVDATTLGREQLAWSRTAAPALPSATLPGAISQRLQSVLDAAFSELDAKKLRRTRAIVILVDGHVVAEKYAPGFNAQTPQIGWSMSKTLIAALIGVRVAQGKLTLEQKNLLPEWRSDGRSDITLNQLLRMSSGLEFDEGYGNPRSDVVRMLYESGDMAHYAAAKPLLNVPGTVFKYSSGTTQILSRVLRDTFQSDERAYRDFPRQTLFAPLGMENATLELDESGTFAGAAFTYASAHDWARVGQFLLNDGVWQSQRLLPEGWVRYMTTPAPAAAKKNYGAQIWLAVPEPYNSVASKPPALPSGTFHLIGHDAQFVSVVPQMKLVVVRLGVSRKRPSWDHETFLAAVIDAFRR